MYDATNTFKDLQDSAVDMAILPVGAIEQHGPHLPLGVDWMEADAIAKGVAHKLGAYLLPAMPFGNSQAHDGFRGSVSLSFDTLAAVVKDIALSLLDQGFTRIVVINLHGGNIALKTAVRELNWMQQQGKVLLVGPVSVAGKRLSDILDSLGDEKHAGEWETSLMLNLSPELVREGRVDHVPDLSPEYFDYLPMKPYCPEGVWGRSSLATLEKGRRVLEIMVEETARHIQATFRRLDQLQSE
jgi:creatinine amidohydrolase